MKKFLITSLLLLLLAGANALADTITFNLITSNMGGFAGPYATVTIGLTSSNTANVTFTGLNDGTYSYLLMDGGSAALNVNATSATASNFSCTQLAAFSACSLMQGASGNADGFGSFNLIVDNVDGFQHAMTSLGFTVTGSGANWVSAADVLTANANGQLAATHVAPCIPGSTCDPAIANNSTQYASGASVVPETTSLVLFGSGLLAMGGVVRRRLRLGKS